MENEDAAVAETDVAANNSCDQCDNAQEDGGTGDEDCDPPPNDDDGHTSQNRRQRSSRHKSKPDRFVPHPSKQDQGVEEAHRLFLAGGSSKSAQGGKVRHGFFSEVDVAAIARVKSNKSKAEIDTIGRRGEHESSPLVLLAMAATNQGAVVATKQEQDAAAKSSRGGSKSRSYLRNNVIKRNGSTSDGNGNIQAENSNDNGQAQEPKRRRPQDALHSTPAEENLGKTEVKNNITPSDEVGNGKSKMLCRPSPPLTRRLFCGKETSKNEVPPARTDLSAMPISEKGGKKQPLDVNSKDRGILVMKTTTQMGTTHETIEINSDDDEDVAMNTVHKSMISKRFPTRRSGRQRKSMSSAENNDFLDDDEVQFVFSSSADGGARSSSISRGKRTHKSPQHSSEQYLKRSKRKISHTAELRACPLNSYTAEDDTGKYSADEKRHHSSKHSVRKKAPMSALCKYEGCEKYLQSKCKGYCRAHFVSSNKKNCEKKQSNERLDAPQDNPKNHQKPTIMKKLDIVAQEPEKADMQSSGEKYPSSKAAGCQKYAQKPLRAKSFEDEQKLNARQPKVGADSAHLSPAKLSANKKGGSNLRINSTRSSPEELSRSHFGRIMANGAQNLIPKESCRVANTGNLGMGDCRAEGVGHETKDNPSTNGEAGSLKCDAPCSGEDKGVVGCLMLPSCDESLLMPNAKELQHSKPATKKITKPSEPISKAPFKPPVNEAEEDDNFSFSELEVPASLNGDKGERREINLDKQLSSQMNRSPQTLWRCSQCGDLNSSVRCSTCRNFERSTSERALLERTRYELLNGRDFWICTRCKIGINSLTSPCGGCKRMISFVPLEIGEFEEFVQKQRQSRQEKIHQWQCQWHKKIEELHCEEWSDEEEDEKPGHKSAVNLDWYKNNGPHGKFFCKYHGCKSSSHPNGGGFCSEHRGDHKDPAPYPLVLPEDRDLVTEVVYLALAQMVPCKSVANSEKYLSSDYLTGYPGLSCKHCRGKPNCTPGRWFPSSDKALKVAKKAFINHLRNCKHCPKEVKEKLELAEKTKSAPNGNLKKFYHRVWSRLHQIPLSGVKGIDAAPRNNEKKIPVGEKRKKSLSERDASFCPQGNLEMRNF